ncbi:hypothetical protein [Defluviimonas salinarum]|uniref:Uncharacterized protein n=1 Tax=Defluviimonas salinarum TaxID=2992147 RepID=A0ABT3JAC4_9RHOB|nr:hypothetical protein [Defluviimonas salinarum]MCW3784658.1 hypothetical protein [Defluviimonas salinarum]
MARLLASAAICLAQAAVAAAQEGSACSEGGNYADVIYGFEAGADGQFATNPGSTATGAYQFTYGTLASLGYIDESASKHPPSGAGSWDGVVWTGQDGVWSRDQFMANMAAQDTALSRLTQSNLASISGSYTAGEMINGVPISDGGAAAAAHMLGAGGFNKWAASGFTAAGLDPAIAAAHGMSPDEYNDHMMRRVAAGGCHDPADIQSSSTPVQDIPEIYLMPWATPNMVPAITPGQIRSLLAS